MIDGAIVSRTKIQRIEAFESFRLFVNVLSEVDCVHYPLQFAAD